MGEKRRLTSINILDRGLRQRAPHSLFRALRLEFFAHGIVASSIERPLKAVTLPAEDVVTMLRVPGPARTYKSAALSLADASLCRGWGPLLVISTPSKWLRAILGPHFRFVERTRLGHNN